MLAFRTHVREARRRKHAFIPIYYVTGSIYAFIPQERQFVSFFLEAQVLRAKIGTAMTNKSSRTVKFSLSIHGHEWEWETQEGFL